MAKVTEQTVEIKKSPRSTFGISSSKSGTARIGNLNVVYHKMLEPSDMIRCQVDTEILFVSPLKVPAFAKMKVLTYYFFDAYQNVFDDFNNTIQNYTHETKSELKNGTIEMHSNFRLPFIRFRDLSAYVCTALHWVEPNFADIQGYPYPPFGNPTDYEDAQYYSYQNFPLQRSLIFSSYEQKKNIADLCNQFDIPYGALIPLSKKFQNALYDSMSLVQRQTNDDLNFSWTGEIQDEIWALPFIQYWKSYPHSAPYDLPDNYEMLRQNFLTYSNDLFINVLPFKCYQHIFNDWFLDTQRNLNIDFFPSLVAHDVDTTNIGWSRIGGVTLDSSTTGEATLVCGSFQCYMPHQKDNYLMNSIFGIRQPWYSKDYFNVSTNDPTLGVSPYAVGNSILDLRKNSALQRLAEKKALCGNKLVDFIAQHFNFYPPELDIARSIHLGTSVGYVNVSQVLQSSQTTDTSPQGERAATAQSYERSKGVFFKAPTYGEFMVLQCIKPEIDYFDGIPREMQIVDVADMPLPELSQIGFDQIKSSELYVNPMESQENIFGYTPRYSWRKTQQNRIYGELANTLNFWHQSPSLRFGVTNDWRFGQIGFDTPNPSLLPNTLLYSVSPSFNRIFAVTDVNDDTYVYRHNIQCTLNTCLPTNDSPQL